MIAMGIVQREHLDTKTKKWMVKTENYEGYLTSNYENIFLSKKKYENILPN